MKVCLDATALMCLLDTRTADNDLRPYFVRIAQIETAFIQEPFYPLLEKPNLTFRSERLALCW